VQRTVCAPSAHDGKASHVGWAVRGAGVPVRELISPQSDKFCSAPGKSIRPAPRCLAEPMFAMSDPDGRASPVDPSHPNDANATLSAMQWATTLHLRFIEFLASISLASG
jgi:hypothetical protein